VVRVLISSFQGKRTVSPEKFSVADTPRTLPETALEFVASRYPVHTNLPLCILEAEDDIIQTGIGRIANFLGKPESG
jgi:hypothetical protein